MTESLRTDELVQVFGHGDDSGARIGHCDEEVPHLRQILDPILSWGQDKWDRSRVQCAVGRLAGLPPPQTIPPSGIICDVWHRRNWQPILNEALGGDNGNDASESELREDAAIRDYAGWIGLSVYSVLAVNGVNELSHTLSTFDALASTRT
ncbi:hypothetical protein BJV77DRAFT_962562 [Russula vinacea]|nr:hypothetical protein BJV77DRAFT_962562 [Russula vinacea]